MDYFINCTDGQIRTIAKFEASMMNEPLADDASIEECKEYIQSVAGDTAVKVLYETKHHLVFVSVDSSIEVLFVVDKSDMSKGQSFEL